MWQPAKAESSRRRSAPGVMWWPLPWAASRNNYPAWRGQGWRHPTRPRWRPRSRQWRSNRHRRCRTTPRIGAIWPPGCCGTLLSANRGRWPQFPASGSDQGRRDHPASRRHRRARHAPRRPRRATPRPRHLGYDRHPLGHSLGRRPGCRRHRRDCRRRAGHYYPAHRDRCCLRCCCRRCHCRSCRYPSYHCQNYRCRNYRCRSCHCQSRCYPNCRCPNRCYRNCRSLNFRCPNRCHRNRRNHRILIRPPIRRRQSHHRYHRPRHLLRHFRWRQAPTRWECRRQRTQTPMRQATPGATQPPPNFLAALVVCRSALHDPSTQFDLRNSRHSRAVLHFRPILANSLTTREPASLFPGLPPRSSASQRIFLPPPWNIARHGTFLR